MHSLSLSIYIYIYTYTPYSYVDIHIDFPIAIHVKTTYDDFPRGVRAKSWMVVL